MELYVIYMSNYKTYKGKFNPRNPKKYKGDVNNIIYRSSWELRAFKYFDDNLNVLEWQSEELAIPYHDPSTGKYRRYFPDIVATVKKDDGKIRTMVIEIKPEKQTKEPIKQKKVSKRYILEVTTWATNKSKWETAINFCKIRDWDFVLMTELELGIKYK